MGKYFSNYEKPWKSVIFSHDRSKGETLVFNLLDLKQACNSTHGNYLLLYVYNFGHNRGNSSSDWLIEMRKSPGEPE